LEVYSQPPEQDQFPSSIQYYDLGKEHVQHQGVQYHIYSNDSSGSGKSDPEGLWKRLIKWLPIIVASFLLVAVIIVTAVLGSMLAKATAGANDAIANNTRSSGSNSSCPNANSDFSASLIRPNSALAVTGNTFGNDISLQLFFQGTDNRIYSIYYQSNFGVWSNPRSTITPGIQDSPMAIGQILISQGTVRSAALQLSASPNTCLLLTCCDHKTSYLPFPNPSSSLCRKLAR
jgi:hypothetical protein